MKLIKTAADHHQFLLASREKDLLWQVLGLYPVIPSGYQPLSRGAACEPSNQPLLDEALTEARSEGKKFLESLCSDARRLSRTDNAWRLTLSSEELEWLLQILNDVRIGSWIRLGSPEVPLNALTAENGPHFWAMESAGYFQMRFLELVRS